MTIYNYLEIIFLMLFFIEMNGVQTDKRRNKFFYLEAFMVFAILAFRNCNVGADSLLYTSYYTNPSTYRGEMPIAFEAFCNLLKLISNKWQFFIFMTSCLAVFPFFYCVKKYAKYITLPFLTFLLCWKQLWLLETPIKQTTAIAFFFAGYLMWKTRGEKKNNLRDIISIALIIASFFTHSTLLMYTPFIIALEYVNFTKKWAIITILSTVGLASAISTFIPAVYDTLYTYSMAYEIFSNVGNYTMDIEYGLKEYDIKLFLMPSLYSSALIYMCDKDEINTIQAKYLVVGIVIFNLFASFPNIPRVVLYFTLIGSSLCPKEFRLYYKGIKRQIVFISVFILWIAFLYVHYKLCSTFVLEMEADYLPYSFWL